MNYLEIGLGVGMFIAIVMALVFIIMFAKSKLVTSGDVTITINGEKEIQVASGGTLLSTLGNQKVFLPSACGGGGTCAMCRCQVMDGGGDVLPTEMNHLTRKEAGDNWRLGCQVKVKQPLHFPMLP